MEEMVFNGPMPEGMGELGADGRYIRDILLSEWFAQFCRKAADYNDNENENHRQLGVQGQFADIWRKIGKLKKALWDGYSLVGEQPREILMDLIAHCFLTIAMMDSNPGDGGPSAPAVMVAGEPWQGRIKAQPKAEEDRLWPNCGRERCVVHAMVPLSELRAAGVVKIQPGEPKINDLLPIPEVLATGSKYPGVRYCHG